MENICNLLCYENHKDEFNVLFTCEHYVGKLLKKFGLHDINHVCIPYGYRNSIKDIMSRVS